ncbi:unnamed protein product [Nezara viridula]|uniref:Gustatory receptor n=1 Tax=Nezara viridula TaxID=85310 RepID=A0A9P0HA88_NEZVI|nr:unnamed protein product [Nezara viridula]
MLLPTVSIFWLWINLKKFSKLFKRLKEVEDLINKYDLLTSGKYHIVLFAIITPLFIIEFIKIAIPRIVVISLYFMMTNVYLILIQFTSILATVSSFYSFLEKSLNDSTALKWVRCHEVLGTCCEIVNRCYSPQLLIFILSNFSYITSTIYLIITDWDYYTQDDQKISLLWLLISSLTVWVVVFHCHETVQKAKSFDKALSRLVLNDNTNRLLRNKKIIYHFKPKREVEFLAMGFLSFDYPLLFRMISTATTYIAIMVQFTPKDKLK